MRDDLMRIRHVLVIIVFARMKEEAQVTGFRALASASASARKEAGPLSVSLLLDMIHLQGTNCTNHQLIHRDKLV